jgi:xeroderma pigmentosum group C-complementing protein
VSILDVSPLKPDQSFRPIASGSSKRIFNTSTPMVSKKKLDFMSPKKSLSYEKEKLGESSLGHSRKSTKHIAPSNMDQSTDPSFAEDLNRSVTNFSTSQTSQDINPESHITDKSHKPKRKGDLEFEMQLEMALSVTAIGSSKSKEESSENADSSRVSCPSKRIKRVVGEESSTSTQLISTAVGSMKVGSPLYWAEVYCSEENLTGKWVHIDAVNLIIDGEDKVEAMVAACKASLRYVVAFAGQGAKDVTRRFDIFYFVYVQHECSDGLHLISP